jgi:hypothetical protein
MDSPTMNVRQKIAVVVLDIAVLAELFVAMYFASRSGDSYTLIFFKYFFSMLIPTLLIAWIVVKRLKTQEPESTT